MHFKLWLFTSQPFHLDVSETNKQFFFYLYFQEVYIPYYCSANTQRGQKQQEIFWINASSDVLKNDSQPFSQLFTLPVNQCGKECQGPRV